MSCICNAMSQAIRLIKMNKMLVLCICLAAALQLGTSASSDPLDDVLANDAPYFTTNFGQPVFSENASLTVGPRGETFFVVPASRDHSLDLGTTQPGGGLSGACGLLQEHVHKGGTHDPMSSPCSGISCDNGSFHTLPKQGHDQAVYNTCMSTASFRPMQQSISHLLRF